MFQNYTQLYSDPSRSIVSSLCNPSHLGPLPKHITKRIVDFALMNPTYKVRFST